jgi:hypothetical protein
MLTFQSLPLHSKGQPKTGNQAKDNSGKQTKSDWRNLTGFSPVRELLSQIDYDPVQDVE